MNTIKGKILHTETGLGIKDLIIVAYDLDPTLFGTSNEGTHVENYAEINIRPSDNPDTLANRLIRGQLLYGRDLETYLRLIYFGPSRGDQEEDYMLKTPFVIAGDRIGSVITNDRGEFSLSYDDAAFQINDNELRPDLVLYVLAPEYSVEIAQPDVEATSSTMTQTEIVPVPENLRVLHFTLFPRRNAGRLESFIVKLNSGQLQRQQITPPDRSMDNPVDFSSLLNSAHLRHAVVQQSLNSALQTALNRKRQIEQDSYSFIQNLSAVPIALRSNALFVGQGTSSESAIDTARQRGVELISNALGRARIRLSESDFAILGIRNIENFRTRINDSGSIRVNTTLDSICGFLQQKNGGTQLTRQVPDLLRQLRNISESITSEPSEDLLPPVSENDVEEHSSLSMEDRIKQIVMERVQEMKLLEPGKAGFEDDQIKRINKTIRDLTPPASPADATAYYDFHHLQIAFPDVWAEAFDGDVTELIRQMDIQYREYTDELAVERDPDELNPSNLTDVNEYTRLMGKLIGDIASLDNVPPMPEKVRDLIARALTSPVRSTDGITRVKVGVNGASPGSVVIKPGGAFVVRAGSTTISHDNSHIDQIWQQLSIAQKEMLIKIATDQITEEVTVPSNEPGGVFQGVINQLLKMESADMVNAAVNLLREVKQHTEVRVQPVSNEEKIQRTIQIINNPEGRVTRLQRYMKEVAERLHEPHSFRVFQKNTVNFGMVTTYRQKWIPGNYQVGDLVSSLPLAPGESRKYSKKQAVKRSISKKENDKHASTLSDERAYTSRATSDIVEKANTTTNFQQSLTTELSGNVFGFTVGANTNTSFSRNQTVESQKTKNSFHEAVRKAAQEYKNERSLEISSEETREYESTLSSEISNPNNEITVTYLFYELERQYKVSEQLHKLTPVILVAQEIPNPADIDEDWLLAHEWILKRVLLDNSFNAALDYISEGLAGDEISLEVKREHYEMQKELVEELSSKVSTLSALQETMRETLTQTAEQEKLAVAAQDKSKKRRRRNIARAIFGIPPRIAAGDSSLAFGNRNEDPAALEARREALETRLGFLEGNLEDARSQLAGASNALEKAKAELTAAIEYSFTKRNLVNQFRIHVKENILYYMQHKWRYENSDQLYFRLYDIPVRIPIPAQAAPPADAAAPPLPRANITFERFADSNILNALGPLLRNSVLREDLFSTLTLPPPSPVHFEERRLHEIADLDNLMGFKGNYMIFPLKQCTYITNFMMQDYIDDYFGIRDPDPVGNFTTDELLRYAESLYHSDEYSDEEKAEVRAAVNRLVQDRLTTPRVENDLIVVPTGQLFIEALKGEHALLENFKQLHRKLDVQKVEEEVRSAQLENLRKAMRLTQEEPLMESSKVDKKIIIQGNSSGVIVPPEA